MATVQPHVPFKKKKYARGRQHVARPVAMGSGASAEPDVRSEAAMKPAAHAPDSPAMSKAASRTESGAHRSRYCFPKTPWHSPLPDPAVRPAAVPPVFVPIADEDEVERRIMLHHRKRRSWGAKLGRALLYTFSIVLVLVAGLITTVWVEENGGLEATVAMLVSKSSSPGAATGDNPRAQPSRHELPYDGQAPDEPAPLAARSVIPGSATGPADGAAPAAATGTRQEAPAPPAPASNNAAQSRSATNAPAPAAPAGASGDAAVAGLTAAPASSGTGAAGETARSKEPSATVPAAPAAEGRPARGDKVASSVAKAPSKSKASPQKVARGKEITRIQRQAAEELKKKTRNRQHIALTGAAKPPARHRAAMTGASYTKPLAQCHRIDNIFRRERCKWNICAGKWGKGGCPAYVAARFTTD